MLETVFDCHLSPVSNGNQKITFFWSTFVDSIDVFDCRLSGVVHDAKVDISLELLVLERKEYNNDDITFLSI